MRARAHTHTQTHTHTLHLERNKSTSLWVSRMKAPRSKNPRKPMSSSPTVAWCQHITNSISPFQGRGKKKKNNSHEDTSSRNWRFYGTNPIQTKEGLLCKPFGFLFWISGFSHMQWDKKYPIELSWWLNEIVCGEDTAQHLVLYKVSWY